VFTIEVASTSSEILLVEEDGVAARMRQTNGGTLRRLKFRESHAEALFELVRFCSAELAAADLNDEMPV